MFETTPEQIRDDIRLLDLDNELFGSRQVGMVHALAG